MDKKNEGELFEVSFFLGVMVFVLSLIFDEERNIAILHHSHLFYSVTVVVIFAILGIFSSVMGSILSGFTLSLSLHAIFLGNGIQDIFFWKDIFDFFDISSTSIKIIFLLVLSLVSAADSLTTLLTE